MAMADMYYSFSGKPKRLENVQPGHRVDEDVERAIDQAGREKVLARAKALGWIGEVPPKWVWLSIAADVMRENSQPSTGKDK